MTGFVGPGGSPVNCTAITSRSIRAQKKTRRGPLKLPARPAASSISTPPQRYWYRGSLVRGARLSNCPAGRPGRCGGWFAILSTIPGKRFADVASDRRTWRSGHGISPESVVKRQHGDVVVWQCCCPPAAAWPRTRRYRCSAPLAVANRAPGRAMGRRRSSGRH